MSKIANGMVLASMFLLSTSAIAQDDIANGKTKYEQNCLVCHGDKGHGDGVASAGLSHKPENISKELNQAFEFKYFLAREVLNGKLQKGMPSFAATLSRQDVYDIFAYIESVQ